MKHYFITGSSKGLGKGLAELLLSEGHKVWGLSRTSSIKHENYSHLSLDFSDLNKVNSYSFPVIEDADEVILINNAGMIGEIGTIGQLEDKSPQKIMDVNVTAPIILCNKFIRQFELTKANKSIINISSGAGQSPISGWANYCASKAALDMFSQTVQKEQANKSNPIDIYSVAPGIMDTDMQAEIRSSDINRFDRVNEFVDYKKNNELKSSKSVASLIFEIVNVLKKDQRVVGSVRELTNY